MATLTILITLDSDLLPEPEAGREYLMPVRIVGGPAGAIQATCPRKPLPIAPTKLAKAYAAAAGAMK